MQNNIEIKATVKQGNNINCQIEQSQQLNANSTQRGPQGPRGEQGIPGEAATIEVGTVTTGAAGSDVSVINSGTTSAAILDFIIPRGDKGEQGETGNGIINTEKVSTVGLVDTYHVNYTNGNYNSFTVTNGRNSEGSVADVLVNGASVLDGDIAKVIVPTNNNELINGANYVNSTTLTNTLNSYALKSSLAAVATSGDYNDLINKPVIPDSATWGNITGTLSNQTDLQNALNAKTLVTFRDWSVS